MAKKLSKRAYLENSKRNEARKLQSELPLPKIPKISVELTEWLHNYKLNKECGIKLKEKFFNGVPFESNDKMHLLSKFFIQSVLQSTYKGESKVYLKSIFPNHYNKIQNIVDSQIANFNHFLGLNKIEIEHKYFEFTNPKFDGTIDIVALDNKIKTIVPSKKRILIKLLFTNEFDSVWSFENVRDNYGKQVEPLHHKMLANWEWGIDNIPFYYFIFSSKSEYEYRVIHIDSLSDTITHHYSIMSNVKEYLDNQIVLGFKPKATITNCSQCTIKETCKHKTEIPTIQTIKI